jgi:hypothetical protein
MKNRVKLLMRALKRRHLTKMKMLKMKVRAGSVSKLYAVVCTAF